MENRAARSQIIGGGAGGSGDDDAVRPERRERQPVDHCLEFDEARDCPLAYNNFVQRMSRNDCFSIPNNAVREHLPFVDVSFASKNGKCSRTALFGMEKQSLRD